MWNFQESPKERGMSECMYRTGIRRQLGQSVMDVLSIRNADTVGSTVWQG